MKNRNRSRKAKSRRWIAERLEDRRLLASNVMHNPVIAEDVNSDGYVSMLDAVTAVRMLNEQQRLIYAGEDSSGVGTTNLQGMPDVSGDGDLSFQDVGLILRFLNRVEGEGPDLTIDPVTVNEASGTADFTVRLSAASATNTVLTLTTGAAGDTATAGIDYTPTTTQITINAGSTTGTFSVPILGDPAATAPVNEPTETFTVRVASVDSGMVNSTGTGTGTIEDGRGIFVVYDLDTFSTADQTQEITTITAGEELFLRIQTEDVRDGLPNFADFNLAQNELGVGAAFLDVVYDPKLLRVNDGTSDNQNPDGSGGAVLDFDISYEVPEPVPFGTGGLPDNIILGINYPYGTVISGEVSSSEDAILNSPSEPVPPGEGALNEVGGSRISAFGDSQAFVADVRITAKGVNAVDDAFTVQQNSTNQVLNVLGQQNGNGEADSLVSGMTTFAGSPTDVRETLVLLDSTPGAGINSVIVADSEIQYDNATINVVQPAGASLQLVSVVDPGNDHTATVVGGAIQFTPAAGFTGDVTFDYTISNGRGSEDTGTVTVTVESSNAAPNALDVSIAAIEDGNVVNGNFNANDVDNPASELTYTILNQPSSGTASKATPAVAGDTAFQFDPGSGFQELRLNQTTTVTFDYRVTDLMGASDDATVTVTVTGVNDDPTANNDSFNVVNTGVTVTLDVIGDAGGGADTDPDVGDPLTITNVTDPGDATVAIVGNQIEYTPLAGNIGTTGAANSFMYTIEDEAGVTSTATVTITLVENDPPVAGSDSFATNEDTVLTGVNVLPNDTDSDGTITGVTAFDATSSMGATVTVSSTGEVTYDPTGSATLQALSANQVVNDTFTYTIQDNSLGTAIGTVTIAVTGVNDAPTGGDTTVSTDEDVDITDGDISGLVTDVDSGDTLSFTTGTTTSDGTLNLNSNGTFTYSPNLNFNGTDSFTYSVSDGNGGTAGGTVTITVNPINDAPTNTNPTHVVARDITSTLTFGANDVDNDALTYIITTPPGEGSASTINNANGTFVFDPGNDFDDLTPGQSRDVTVEFTVSDGTAPAVSGTVTITVVPNNPPNAVDDPASGTLTTPEDTALTGIDVLANDSDVEGDAFSIINTTPATAGVILTITGSGQTAQITYDPSNVAAFDALPAGSSAQDTFTYTIQDAIGGTDTATVTVTVTGVDDDPTAIDATTTLTTNEDTLLAGDVSGNIIEVDTNDALTFSIVSGVSNGSLLFNPNGSFTYNPRAEFSGSDSFTYQASDGEGTAAQSTVNITVVEVNDDPIANNDAVPIFTGGGAQIVNVLSNDLPGPAGSETNQQLSVTNVSAPTIVSQTAGTTGAAGTVDLTAGVVRYTPSTDFVGEVQFTYTLSDGEGGTDTGTVTLSVRNSDPSTIRGVVYADVNNNGQRDAGELGFANVPVTLTGVDSFGVSVNVTVNTNASGAYVFDTNGQGGFLSPSDSYNVRVGSVANTVTGIHSSTGGVTTPNDNITGQFSATVASSDSFRVDIGALGGATVITNFAMVAASSWVDLDHHFDTIAIDSGNGFLFATNTSGDQFWGAMLSNFDVHSLEVDASQGFDRVMVSVQRTSTSAVQQIRVNMYAGDTRMRFHGVNPGNANEFILRFDGTIDDLLGLAAATAPSLEGEVQLTAEDVQMLAASRASGHNFEAVDAAFGDGSFA